MTGAADRQRGFTYMAAIFLVAILAIAMLGGRVVEATEVRRSKEQALIDIGHQFRAALASYVQSSNAAGPNAYPASLDDLVEDKRFPDIRRHLRKIYYDPFTGRQEWGLVYSGGRIVGIYSLAAGTPLKQAGFDGDDVSLNGAHKYSDWVFTWPVTGASGAQVSPAGQITPGVPRS